MIAAAKNGNGDIVKLLLEKGANADTKIDVIALAIVADVGQGSTALTSAAFFNRAEIVEILIEGEASIDSADKEVRS